MLSPRPAYWQRWQERCNPQRCDQCTRGALERDTVRSLSAAVVGLEYTTCRWRQVPGYGWSRSHPARATCPRRRRQPRRRAARWAAQPSASKVTAPLVDQRPASGWPATSHKSDRCAVASPVADCALLGGCINVGHRVSTIESGVILLRAAPAAPGHLLRRHARLADHVDLRRPPARYLNSLAPVGRC